MDGSLLLAYGGHIKQCVDVVLQNGGIQPDNFSVGPGKDVVGFLERPLQVATSSKKQDAPSMISSTTLGLVEILILMVGEMLAMFPSSKASGVGMGFLNQSTFP